MKDKCIILTTINSYKDTSIKYFEKYKEYDIIVVGDMKTPHESYLNNRITYLHPNEHTDLFPKLSKEIPFNHYCRKNIGYLYAVKKGYKEIFETDDDNYPLYNFDTLLNEITYEVIKGPKIPDILRLYTDIHIWPRGYPLELVQNKDTIKIEKQNKHEKIGIYQGLAEGDPDVDAIFRLTNENFNNMINFKKDKGYIFSKGV